MDKSSEFHNLYLKCKDDRRLKVGKIELLHPFSVPKKQYC